MLYVTLALVGFGGKCIGRLGIISFLLLFFLCHRYPTIAPATTPKYSSVTDITVAITVVFDVHTLSSSLFSGLGAGKKGIKYVFFYFVDIYVTDNKTFNSFIQ